MDAEPHKRWWAPWGSNPQTYGCVCAGSGPVWPLSGGRAFASSSLMVAGCGSPTADVSRHVSPCNRCAGSFPGPKRSLTIGCLGPTIPSLQCDQA